jgi:outer membrane protein assembly factor BamB
VGGEAFDIAWKRSVGKGSTRKLRLSSPPIASDDAIYILDSSQTIRALDLSGRQKWSTQLKSEYKRDKYAVGGGIALAGDKLIVTSGYGYVTALSLGSGDELWKRTTQAPVTGAPTVDDQYAYFTSSNNEIYVVSLDTGDIVWTDQAIAESARILKTPSPAKTDGLLAVPFSSGEMIAYVPENGRRLWSDSLTRGGRFTPISAINDIAGRPVLDSGAVYAASQSGVLVSIDEISGTRLWSKPLSSIQTPAISGQFLFAVGIDGMVVCFDKSTGGVIWTKKLRRFEDEKDRKGKIVWTGPVIASNHVVLASSSGKAVALDPQSGEIVKEIKVGGSVYIEPIVAHGRVYLLTDDADLVAIE